MTKKELVKIVRNVVKREIKSAIKSEINEALNILEHKKTKPQIPKNYTKNTLLNEVLNNTKVSNEFKAYPEVSVNELRNKFGGMQSGASPATQMTDINNRPIDVSNLGSGLDKALTRDYSELVKRFKK
tara:strand:- start:8721 stop:9104 length:384 start_codon:yes stop_codon:yes gene_type:complete